MTDQMLLLAQLFGVFFLLGMFTFGGGYAIMSLIQSEIVSGRGWITESCFTDIAAISQMTPGPIGLNCSTYVGYEVMKSAGAGEFLSTTGSLTASLAIVLPSFLIMLAIVRFYTRFHGNNIFKGVMNALRPAVAGLIGAAGLALMLSVNLGEWEASLVTENFMNWKSWVLFAAACILSLFTKAGPIEIILGGGILGLLLF